jgi:hypothetical protein
VNGNLYPLVVRQAHHERVPEEISNVKDFEMRSLSPQPDEFWKFRYGIVTSLKVP